VLSQDFTDNPTMGNLEFDSERIPRSLLRGKQANAERYCSIRIEDSPQLAAESFNIAGRQLFITYSAREKQP
jgi:hypothetical protein